ncbi:MAG TPA: M23 family metallopeptidase [Longimicrobiaceae bacterium]|nr:M23 family metallopeptidase [Longimicrobiaceae bacterium]
MTVSLPVRSPVSARSRSTDPRPRSGARRFLLRSVVACGALALLADASPLAAQSGGRGWKRDRQGYVDQLFGAPRLEHLSRLAGRIQIPVEGVRVERLRDSFREGRSGGRVHEAIDIHAPRGTPVVAAADGTILRMRSGGLGGNYIFHLDEDGRTRYYYAHLDRWAEGLREGQRVERGDTIGYVGDTGNATPGDFHLHFSVVLLEDARQWWRGSTPLNPYALLTGRGLGR